MPRLLLSNRRTISRTTVQRITDHLANAFGGPRSVIQEVGGIRYDADFRAHIDRVISRCDAVLVVIDPAWLSGTDSQGARRIDNPEDFVRLEIESALKRGKLVVPVLIEGAAMPHEDALPQDVRPLAFRPSVQLRPDPHFNTDLERLASEVRTTLAAGGVQLTPSAKRMPSRWRWGALGALVLVVLAGLILAVRDLTLDSGDDPLLPLPNAITRTALVQVATATRIAVLQAIPGTPEPGSSPADAPITAANAARVVPAGLWGRGQVNAAIYSPDGARIAVAGSLGVWLFDAASLEAQAGSGRDGPPPLLLAGHTDAVTCLVFSPDGSELATGSRDGTARVWDVATGTTRLILAPPADPEQPIEAAPEEGQTDAVLSVAWSPDGLLIATGGHDSNVRLWNAATGDPLWLLSEQEDAILGVAFSPDSLLLASASADDTVRLWDMLTGESVLTLTGRLYAWSVDFHPSGSRLIVAGGDGRLRVWNVTTSEEVVTLEGHSNIVRSVAWSPGGAMVASGGDDHTVRLWNLRDEVLVANLRGHLGAVLSVDFSPDGQRLLSAGADDTVRVWNVESGTALAVLRGFTGEMTLLALHPDGGRGADEITHEIAAVAARGGLVSLLDLGTGRIIERLPVPPAQVAAWSPDGARLVLGEASGRVRVWDVAAARTVHLLVGPEQPVGALAWSPDGAQIAVGGQSGVITLWDAVSGRAIRTLDQSPGWVTALVWSPDGAQLAAGSTDYSVRVWNAAAGMLVRRLTGHTARVNALAWSPDGTRLASASLDKTIRVWTRTGRAVLTLTGHNDWVNDVAWTADSSVLASASYDGTIWLWDTASGEPLRILADHASWVERVVFSADGRRLISASWDGTVRQWSVR